MNWKWQHIRQIYAQMFCVLLSIVCLSACGGSSSNAGTNVSPVTPSQSDNPSSSTSVSILFGSLNDKERGYVGMGVDDNGNAYFIDTAQKTVMKASDDGTVSRIAGVPGVVGDKDGSVDSATFNVEPSSRIAADHRGNVYVSAGGKLRKIGVDGKVTTLSFPQIERIDDFSIDSANNLYFLYECAVWQISSNETLALYAGNSFECVDRDGAFDTARFGDLHSIAVDKSDQIYVAEWSGHLRKINQQREVSSVHGHLGNWQFSDPNDLRLSFQKISSLAVDREDNVYVVSDVESIYKVNPNGMVQVFQGRQIDDSDAADYHPYRRTIAISPSGKIFVNNRFAINQYRVDGTALQTLASIAMDGIPGSFSVGAIAIDKAGNFWFPDFWYDTVRSISTTGVVSTKYGSMNVHGVYNSEMLPAYFQSPRKVILDKDQNIYVLDSRMVSNVRKIHVSGKVSIIKTGKFMGDMAIDTAGNLYLLEMTQVCGTRPAICPATSIWKVTPTGELSSLPVPSERYISIAADKDGNIYASTEDHVILKYDTNGKRSTVAGSSGKSGYQNGDGDKVLLARPDYLQTDSKGNVYFIESDIFAVRKMTPNGHVSTIIDKDTLTRSFPNTNVPYITGLYVDSDDNLYLMLNMLAIAKVKL